jgi:phospholipase C
VAWTIYTDTTPGIGLFITKAQLITSHIKRLDDYFVDAAAGKLPSFAFVDPAVGIGTGSYDNNDEHPPAIAQIGQRFVAEVVDALAKSPQWSRSALFLTYDEHGGLYDHVSPPDACPPDDFAADIDPGEPDKPFDKYGVRVPFIVVSPYAKRHHVGHEIYDHTSITRFIEARFVLPAMTARDANALAPWDMFDFSAPATPPPTISIPAIPSDQNAACAAAFEGG